MIGRKLEMKQPSLQAAVSAVPRATRKPVLIYQARDPAHLSNSDSRQGQAE